MEKEQQAKLLVNEKTRKLAEKQAQIGREQAMLNDDGTNEAHRLAVAEKTAQRKIANVARKIDKFSAQVKEKQDRMKLEAEQAARSQQREQRLRELEDEAA